MRGSRPENVPEAQTLSFVRTYLPPPGSRILEVGCGTGALAAALNDAGYSVIAIDASQKAVLAARSRGVTARQAAWPKFSDSPFDAVLFTRSLHHIDPLSRAVERARELLKVGGVVLVEDFAFSEADARSCAWLYDVLHRLQMSQALAPNPRNSFGLRLLRGHGEFAVWQAEHDDELHPAAAMREALANMFKLELDTTAPYLYRYVSPLLREDASGHTIAREVLDLELEAISMGALIPMGRRWLGRATG